jgi:hypothetical protein
MQPTYRPAAHIGSASSAMASVENFRPGIEQNVGRRLLGEGLQRHHRRHATRVRNRENTCTVYVLHELRNIVGCRRKQDFRRRPNLDEFAVLEDGDPTAEAPWIANRVCSVISNVTGFPVFF